jgi:hypothetical protein
MDVSPGDLLIGGEDPLACVNQLSGLGFPSGRDRTRRLFMRRAFGGAAGGGPHAPA